MKKRTSEAMQHVKNCHNGEGSITLFPAYDRGSDGGSVRFIHVTTVPPGSSIGIHRHGDNRERYIVLEGSGTMIVDGKVIEIASGDCIDNEPYGEHGLENTGSADMILLIFEVD
jgi:mannose-6-phosphate isomerase-like protein (cupin superfamily)